MLENWAKTTLGELCVLDNGVKVHGEKLPLLDVKYLRGKKEAEYLDSGVILNDGQYVILVDGENSGEVFCIHETGYMGSTFKRLACPNDRLLEYLLYIIKFNQKMFRENKKGSAIPHLDKKLFKELSINLPPLAEQGRIVAKIEELFAGIDAGVENLKAVKNQIALYRQSVLKSILSGFATDTLANHVDMCLGKMLDKEKNKGTLFPYLRNKNVRWKNFDLDDLLEMRFEESEEERYSIQRGDLVVCEGGEPGRCAVWENDNVIKFQKALHRLRPHDNMNVYFLMYVFMLNIQAKNWDRFFTGSTIKHLTGEALKNLQIPVPTLAEQERIVAEIESRFERTDALETAVDRALNDAEKLKQAVLKKAFSGELVPQNPDDEPASVLLDRIRTARASEQPARKGKRKR